MLNVYVYEKTKMWMFPAFMQAVVSFPNVPFSCFFLYCFSRVLKPGSIFLMYELFYATYEYVRREKEKERE